MKHIKLFLALALIAALLCACGGNARAEELVGTWQMTAQDSADEVTYLMDWMDLYDEERALVDMNSLNYVLVAEFTADGNYSFTYDAEANKACVSEFYHGVMDALYEGRATLSELYETDLEAMTREEFNKFYAEDVYGMESYDALMEELAAGAYDYSVLGEPVETGTYKVVGFTIMCTVTGETEAEGIGFKLDGDTLTLTYTDGEEVYSRVK